MHCPAQILCRQAAPLQGENTMKKFLAIALALVMMMTASFAMADAIKVGVIGPMTGAYAVYGLAVQYGAEIAAEEINAQGGVQFEILAADDQGDGELGVNAYNDLLDKGLNIMLSQRYFLLKRTSGS